MNKMQCYAQKIRSKGLNKCAVYTGEAFHVKALYMSSSSALWVYILKVNP